MKKKSYTPLYRVLHWSIAICILLLLGTVFLRLTWMNKVNVAAIIQDYLAASAVSLSHDELIVLAKKIRQPMWDWHLYMGYALVGLFSVRFTLPFFGKMKFQNSFNKTLGLKEKVQYWIYLVFYCCVAISLVTGLVIEFGSKSFKKSMEEIHELSIYYLLAFIFLHFGGILVAELTNQKGLVSKMISGNK